MNTLPATTNTEKQQAHHPVAMPPEISRDLLGKIVDEVFDGAIEDPSVIEDVYRVIVREQLAAPAVVNQQVTTAAVAPDALEQARCHLSNAIEDAEDGKTTAALPALREVAHYLAQAAVSTVKESLSVAGVEYLAGQVCGGDAEHNTVNVKLDQPAPWSSLRIGTRLHLSAQQAEAVSNAARDVLAERQRQINAEGWAPDHDDEHDGGELAAAGAAYALHAADYLNPHSQGDGGDEAPDCWPWHDAIAGRGEGPEKTKPAWWKPGAPRRNLIKAGALILAEIERLDRAEQAKQQEQQP